MNYLNFFSSAILLTISTCQDMIGAPKEKPNILFILADDLWGL
jgi:hypothetical protein